jgi:hypothetical protein
MGKMEDRATPPLLDDPFGAAPDLCQPTGPQQRLELSVSLRILWAI